MHITKYIIPNLFNCVNKLLGKAMGAMGAMGVGVTILNPGDSATRAQAITMFPDSSKI